MRQAGGPEHLSHSVVIRRVFDYYRTVLYNDAQQTLCYLVGKLALYVRDEVPLHGVHHNISYSRRELIGRQGSSQLGIHQRKAAAVEGRVYARLPARLSIREHGRVAHLTAGGRHGQHCADGQRACERYLFEPDIPQLVLGLSRAVGYGLGGVYRAAAAYGDHHIRVHLKGLLHAILGVREGGVWLSSAELLNGYAGLFKRSHYTAYEPAPDRAAFSVHQQGSFAVLCGDLARLVLCSSAENHLCG